MLPEAMQHYVAERRTEMGFRLREARTKAGWTQAQAAQYLGCSRAKINRVEQGETDLTGLELELLGNVYEVSVTYFYRRLADYPV